MNSIQWHLLLNHIPILGMGFGLFLWISALLMRSKDVSTLALGWIIFVGLVTIPVYMTGQNGHELVHDLPGVSHTFIDRHEQWATLSLIAIELTAVCAIVLFFILRKTRKSVLQLWTLLFLLPLAISVILVAYTAWLGGEIRHTEMRMGNTPIQDNDTVDNETQPVVPTKKEPKEPNEHHHEHDDAHVHEHP